MLGDNIYHKDVRNNWIQEDSHHSNADGSTNTTNLKRDTSSDNVLISSHFYYFGSSAIVVDLKSIGYHKIRGYKKILLCESKAAVNIILDIAKKYRSERNLVISDPCQFSNFDKRVDQGTGKLYWRYSR